MLFNIVITMLVIRPGVEVCGRPMDPGEGAVTRYRYAPPADSPAQGLQERFLDSLVETVQRCLRLSPYPVAAIAGAEREDHLNLAYFMEQFNLLKSRCPEHRRRLVAIRENANRNPRSLWTETAADQLDRSYNFLRSVHYHLHTITSIAQNLPEYAREINYYQPLNGKNSFVRAYRFLRRTHQVINHYL